MKPVILITGGSRGIGAQVAKLAASDFMVCISYVNDVDAANDVVSVIENDGGSAIAVRADVGSEAEVLGLFNECDQRIGSVDVLINNAGIVSPIAKLEQYTEERLRNICQVNIVGMFLCAREAAKRMSTNTGGRGGAIVNVSSAASRLGSPNEFIDYAATKGAVDSMTLGLSKELAPAGIRVNAVRPGLIETDIHAAAGDSNRVDRLKEFVPMKRGGTAEEVAKTILWLVSDDASYCNGSLIDVAGGR